MRKVARTLEASLSVPEQDRDARREQIRQMTSPLDRIAANGLDVLATNFPRTSALALSSMSRALAGMRYIGHGAFSSVYKDANEVVKVYRHTATMTPDQREQYLTERILMCAALSKYLGPMVTRQTYTIDQHPLGDYQVVLARQAYVEGASLSLFVPDTVNLRKATVADFIERQSRGQAELQKLVNGTFQTDVEEGLVPDLNGWDNFRLAGPSETLTLIDAEPISAKEHRGVHDLILRQAEILGDFIE